MYRGDSPSGVMLVTPGTAGATIASSSGSACEASAAADPALDSGDSAGEAAAVWLATEAASVVPGAVAGPPHAVTTLARPTRPKKVAR